MKLLDIIPSFVWLAVVLLLGGLLVTSNLATSKAKKQLATEVKKHAETKGQYDTYVLDAERKQLVALNRVRELETESQQNTERVAREQAEREQAAAAERARLLAAEQRVRNDFAAFRAATARDAEARDVAALAAKAGTAIELYEACGAEYRSMAAEAESVRIQALGLQDYIRVNPMCSTPFGPGAQ